MRNRKGIKNLKSIGVRDGMGGQGQYRVGRGSIRWAGAVSTVPLPKSDFRHTEKALENAFLVGWAKKIDIISFRTSEKMCVPSLIDLCLRITKL